QHIVQAGVVAIELHPLRFRAGLPLGRIGAIVTGAGEVLHRCVRPDAQGRDSGAVKATQDGEVTIVAEQRDHLVHVHVLVVGAIVHMYDVVRHRDVDTPLNGTRRVGGHEAVHGNEHFTRYKADLAQGEQVHFVVDQVLDGE